MKTDKFITCECHGHGLFLDYFVDEGHDHPAELYITPLGSRSYFDKGSFRWRLQKAWSMLWTGKGDSGEVVLNESNAASLVAYLNKFLRQAEP